MAENVKCSECVACNYMDDKTKRHPFCIETHDDDFDKNRVLPKCNSYRPLSEVTGIKCNDCIKRDVCFIVKTEFQLRADNNGWPEERPSEIKRTCVHFWPKPLRK